MQHQPNEQASPKHQAAALIPHFGKAPRRIKFNTLFYDSGYWKKQMVFDNVEVNPHFAGELMKINTKNRPISNAVTKQYTDDMSNGKWNFCGDSIRISNEGVLLDGQKRLMAVINSGTTQVFNIQTGLDPSAFEVIDTGQERSASDTLSVAGHKNHHIKAGAAKLIMSYKNGTMKRMTGGGNNEKIRNTELLDYVEKNLDEELFEEAATNGNKLSYQAKFFSNKTYAGFFYLLAEKDREAAQLFFELLVTGENISRTKWSTVYWLRKKLIELQSSSVQLRTVDKYALLIKAWNLFKKDVEIKSLQWQPKEDFPVIQ